MDKCSIFRGFALTDLKECCKRVFLKWFRLVETPPRPFPPLRFGNAPRSPKGEGENALRNKQTAKNGLKKHSLRYGPGPSAK